MRALRRLLRARAQVAGEGGKTAPETSTDTDVARLLMITSATASHSSAPCSES